MTMPLPDTAALAISHRIRRAGYRTRWQPLGGRGVVVVGQRGGEDYFTRLSVRGRIAVSHQGLALAGDVPPAIQAIARASWPLRLTHQQEYDTT